MQAEPDNIYRSAPTELLLARELAALDPLLAGIYGRHGLYIRPQYMPEVAEPAHLLGNLITLHIDTPHRLAGALSCAPSQLPFASESFKLIVVQHAAENIAEPALFSDELARVLAPEGVALILGFNPYSAWRPWLALQQRRMPGCAVRLQSPHRWETQLAQYDIDVMQRRYVGSFLPRASAAAQAPDDSARSLRWLSGLRGAYLLLARKRRSTLTPLRLRKAPRERAQAPRLVPGAGRARP
jgi:SAM-dependent methyltransferase